MTTPDLDTAYAGYRATRRMLDAVTRETQRLYDQFDRDNEAIFHAKAILEEKLADRIRVLTEAQAVAYNQQHEPIAPVPCRHRPGFPTSHEDD